MYIQRNARFLPRGELLCSEFFYNPHCSTPLQPKNLIFPFIFFPEIVHRARGARRIFRFTLAEGFHRLRPLLMEKNLATVFAASVEQHSVKTAIFWGDTEITYGQLWAQSRWMAGQLRDNFGVKPGDRVGIWLRNCPEFVPAIYGILLAGAVVVPINNFFKADEVLHILNDAGIDALITEQSLNEAFPKLKSGRAGLQIFTIEEMQQTPGANAPATSARRINDLAVIIYTSGTTGKPKGAMLSHGNLLANVESCRQVLRAVPFDRLVVLLPMFHSFMLTVGVLLPLLVGGSAVLIKALHSPKGIMHEAMARQATILPAIPQ